MVNNDIDIEQLSKTTIESFKRLGEILTNLDEEKIKEILKQYVKPKFSDDEKIILKNIDKEFKWIARDYTCNELYVYEDKPKKNDNGNWEGDGYSVCLETFKHLFQSITCEDKEPYNIEELLKGE